MNQPDALSDFIPAPISARCQLGRQKPTRAMRLFGFLTRLLTVSANGRPTFLYVDPTQTPSSERDTCTYIYVLPTCEVGFVQKFFARRCELESECLCRSVSALSVVLYITLL